MLAAALALRADLGARQGRGGGGAPAGPPVPDPIPTAVSSIIANPAPLIGKRVTVTASVEKTVNNTAFVVDQNRKTAQGEILVIAPALFTVPAADAYVTVVGDLVTFDPVDIATRLPNYKLELPPDVIAQFKGKLAIVATAVVSSSLSDLTKRPPAPMSPEDVKLSGLMQQVSTASAALRTAAGSNDAAGAKAHAAELKKLFSDVEDVFKGLNVMTAMLYASDAMKQADAAGAAAAAGKLEDVTTASAALGQVCTTCHTAHRERQDDGTFRLKK